MRQIFCLLFFSLVMPMAFGAASCQSDSAEILSRVNVIDTALVKGDAQSIINLTDTSLFELSGGKEKALLATKQAMSQMKQAGITVEKSTIGKPSQTYKAGTKSVCFIPKEMMMSVKGVRGRSVGYLIAINNNANDSPWLFLDSAGLQKKPELLWKLVPGLPKDIKLPPNFTELVQ